jgi:hypothetical protein
MDVLGFLGCGLGEVRFHIKTIDDDNESLTNWRDKLVLVGRKEAAMRAKGAWAGRNGVFEVCGLSLSFFLYLLYIFTPDIWFTGIGW